jgi:hypothetical protein
LQEQHRRTGREAEIDGMLAIDRIGIEKFDRAIRSSLL